MKIKQIVKKLVPKKLRDKRRRAKRLNANHAGYLRASTARRDIGEPGPLITDLFEPIKDVPGWFNVDDCGHFFLILSLQSASGLPGDLLEIGSYHGRSTAVMARCLGPGERIVVCDAFQADTDDRYAQKPSPENLLANVERVNPGLDRDRIVIHPCLSNDLKLDDKERFRFIHIDGGHSAEQAYFDLQLCTRYLLPGGVIAMDDYHNERWPGVAEGTDRFLKENPQLRVLADLNRHGALGRKLYLVRAK